MIMQHMLALKMHCLAIASLIDVILRDDEANGEAKQPVQTEPVNPVPVREPGKPCAHTELESMSVMGNPGLQYCKQCGATVDKVTEEA